MKEVAAIPQGHPEASGPREFLTIDEIAELLRLTPAALYTQRYRGEVPGSLGRKVGRQILWRWSDIDEWWRSGR